VRSHNKNIELVVGQIRVAFTEHYRYMQRETQRNEEIQKWLRRGIVFSFSKDSEVTVKGRRAHQRSMPDLFEKQTRQEPSPVNYRRYIPNPMMSGGNNLLPNAAVTVHPLPGGWSLQGTALIEPEILVEATSGVVQITKVPNDQLVAMEAQVYKGA
jgi:hypothetical protein